MPEGVSDEGSAPTERQAPPPAGRASWIGPAVGWIVAAVVLAWWPLTDRLDLPKQALLGATTGLALFAAVLRGHHRADPVLAGLGGVFLLGVGILPAEMGARIEGSLGWLAAGGLGWLVHRAPRGERGERGLAIAGGLVAGLALLQAAGLPWLAGTRAISGTLGGPGHLGWTLAALLPLSVTLPGRSGSAIAGLITAAIVVSGSRTAWAMSLVALPLWALGSGQARLHRALLLGLLLGVGLDAAVGRADLPGRIADVADEGGTARGRTYLWRLALHQPGRWLGAGGGPESFQRVFPAWQGSFLEANPGLERFRSDLRHAHIDVVELGTDLGLVGICLIGWAALRAAAAGPRRDPALAVLVAVAVGGLASPLLSFAPTLALAAWAVGARAPPRPAVAWGVVPLLVALWVGQGLATRRLISEQIRSEATWARITGRAGQGRQRARAAAEIDARNPRAWIELALCCRALSDETCARDALRHAARDLPTDGVVVGAGLAR